MNYLRDSEGEYESITLCFNYQSGRYEKWLQDSWDVICMASELCTVIYHSISLFMETPAPEALNAEESRAETKGDTHQKYPLQLILNVLHARERRHSLNHFHEDAPDSPATQTHTTDSLCAWISQSFHAKLPFKALSAQRFMNISFICLEGQRTLINMAVNVPELTKEAIFNL